MDEHVHDPKPSFMTLSEMSNMLADCVPAAAIDAISCSIDDVLQWNEEGTRDCWKLLTSTV